MKAQEIFKIEHDSCLKCGGCIAMYPNIFEFDENQKVLIKEDVEVKEEEVEKIKSVCPVAVIIDKR